MLSRQFVLTGNRYMSKFIKSSPNAKPASAHMAISYTELLFSLLSAW